MKNKGITLITLVITVITMLILAGVTVTFVTSESSIISKSERAVYQNSITQIEQWLNEEYVKNYSEMPIATNKALALIAYFENDKTLENSKYSWGDDVKNTEINNTDNIFRIRTNETAVANDAKWRYIKDTRPFYCLNIENLLKITNKIDVSEDIDDIENMNGVYAVTADLKVFFIVNWDENELIGINKEDIVEANPEEVIFEAGTEWSKILAEGKDVTYEQVKSKKKYTIPSSGLTNLEGLGEFSSLTELTIKDSQLTSLKGIDGSKNTLQYLWIQNPNIGEYYGLSECTNLKYLYIYNASQEQVDKILKEISKKNFPNLQYLGVIGNGAWSDYHQGFTDERYSLTSDVDVTSIAEFDNFSQTTKNAIKYLFIQNNAIEDISPVSGFQNLVGIRADSNKIKSLSALSNKTNLQYIRAVNNKLTNITDLVGASNLLYLDVRRNYDIEDISKTITIANGSTTTNLQQMKKLTNLWFKSLDKDLQQYTWRVDSDIKLNIDDIKNDKKFLLGLKTGLRIDSKYLKYLVDDDDSNNLELTLLQYKDETIKKSDFEKIGKCPNLTHLSLYNVTIVNDNGSAMSDSDIDQLINTTLSKLKKMKYLQLYNIPKMKTTTFLSNMSALIELDLRACASATNLTYLNNIATMRKLSINNNNINLTGIQTTINRLNGSGYWTTGVGLVLCTENLYRQLENCTSLTRLVCNNYWYSVIGYTGVGSTITKPIDLTNCKNINTIILYNVQVCFKMPENLTYLEFSQTNNNTTKFDLSKCKKLKTIFLSDSNSSSNAIINTFKTIPKSGTNYLTIQMDNQSVLNNTSYTNLINALSGITNLKSFILKSNWHYIGNVNSLNGINNLKYLENLEFTDLYNVTELPDFSGMNSLKTLKVRGSKRICAITEILESSNLNALPNLTSIDFSKNQITNIYGLKVNESTDFPKLSELILTNNCLYDDANSNQSGYSKYYLADDIINKLISKSLRKIYVKNNFFTEYSINSIQKALNTVTSGGIFEHD